MFMLLKNLGSKYADDMFISIQLQFQQMSQNIQERTK